MTCPGCADLHDQVRALTAELDRYRWYRTIGGPPPGYQKPGDWDNERHVEPPSTAVVAPWGDRQPLRPHGSPSQYCGRGICAMFDGHAGPCRA